MGIVAHLDSLKLLPVLNESTWRSIFVSCSTIGGILMRRIACVVFQCITSLNISADALTYGEYTKALSSVDKNEGIDHEEGGQIDQFLFLEEMGLTWFMQQSAQLELAQLDRKNYTKIRNTLSSATLLMNFQHAYQETNRQSWTSMFGLTSDDKPKDIDKSTHTQDSAVNIVSRKLNLSQTYALLGSRKPSALVAITYPRLKNSFKFNTNDASVVCKQVSYRYGTIYDQVVDDNKKVKELYLMSKATLAAESVSNYSNASSSLKPTPSVTPISVGTIESQNKSRSFTQRFASAFSFSRSPNSIGNNQRPVSLPTPPSRSMLTSMSPIQAQSNPKQKLPTVPIDSPIHQLAQKLSFDEEESVGDGEESVQEGSVSDNNGKERSEVDDKYKSIENLNKIDLNSNDIEEDIHVGKELNVVELQSKVNDLFNTDFISKGYAVGIHSYTPCTCGYVMMDEQIMTAWCRFEIDSIHWSKKLSQARNVDMDLVHKVRCPQCSTEFNPELHIRCYKKSISDNTSSNKVISDDSEIYDQPTRSCGEDIEIVWSENVPYISPFGLRFELEEMMCNIGECVTDSVWLHNHNPALFWGIMWFTAKNSFPSGFLASGSNESSDSGKSKFFDKQQAILLDSPRKLKASSKNVWKEGFLIDGPIICGWRPSVVKARVYHLLTTGPSLALDLVDIFPGCPASEYNRLLKVALTKLDSSLIRFREAIIEVAHCNTLLSNAFESGISYGRTIYITLLTLSYLYKQDRMITLPIRDIPIGLTKPFPFDKIFLDTVRCVLSKADFVFLKTTEKEFVDCVPSQDVQSIRIGLGFTF